MQEDPASIPPQKTVPWPTIISLAICAILPIIFYFIAVWAAYGKCATYDEPEHLVSAWIQTHYDDFRADPEDPPLWKYWATAFTEEKNLTILRDTPYWDLMLTSGAQFGFAPVTMYMTHSNATMVLRDARARMAILGVALALVIAAWSWRLAGPIAAAVAIAFFCLDPNFLAHSPLVKNDVPVTLAFLLFMFALWLIGEKVTLPRWLFVAVTLGALPTIKFSGILAFPMLAIALLFRTILPRPWPILKKSASTFPLRLALATALGASFLLTTYILMWAAYGFRFSPTPDPQKLFDANFISKMVMGNEAAYAHGAPDDMTDDQFAKWSAEQTPTFVDRAYRWSDDHHVLPEAWLRGFYYTYGKSLYRPSFFMGKNSNNGWWYFFPAAMLFKTPLATLIALLAAAICYFLLRVRSTSPSPHDPWPLFAFLICPILYMASAMSAHLNLGLRHVFPVYPFLFIFIGVVAARAWNLRPQIAAIVSGVLFLGLCAETISAYPNYIPFFNEAVGGSEGGLHLLGGSDLDWGQDLPLLAHWQLQHPDYQLFLCYAGIADPHYYGLHYISTDGSWAPHDQLELLPLPPVLAISAGGLQGLGLTEEQRAYYSPFMQQEPLAILGGSIYLYKLDENHLPRPRQ